MIASRVQAAAKRAATGKLAMNKTLTARRYAHGTYIICDDVRYAGAVHDLVTGLRFRQLQCSRNRCYRAATRRRNSLYCFYFGPAGGALVMKVSRLHPDERLGRKLDWYLRRLRKDYGREAFNGALWLQAAGINTARPVACWSYGKSWWDRESYFLYERVEGESIDRYIERSRHAASPYQRLVSTCMVEKVVEMTKHLHTRGLRHTDIHSGNVLAEFDAQCCPPDRQAILAGLRVYLIDTDHVRKARVRLPVIKRFVDLRCLRGIDFRDYGRKRFLRDYLGNDSRIWWWALHFWSRAHSSSRTGSSRRAARLDSRLSP
jgi:serine/threonine protein kinase